MKREFLTISNLLSIFRAVLSIPFALVMLLPVPPLRTWAFVFLAVGALTDKLDGDIARWRGEETSWGRILDPLADKVCVAVMSAVLFVLGDIPLWFLIVLLSRDILILAGGMYLKASRGVVLPSNTAGKWTAGVIALTIVVLLLNLFPGVQWVFLAACLAGLALSLALYVARFMQVVRQAGA